jgi:hemerythrin-like metal-binding protein
MAVMHWNEKMSVGVPELDADHRELIKVINRLGADSGDESRRSAVRQSLFALLRYAEFHFAREEKVMAACEFPGLGEHQGEHRNFVQRIRTLSQQFDADPDGSADIVNEALLTFLKDWLNHHILIEDMAYRPHVEDHPEARKAARAFKATEIWWKG